MQSSHLPLTDIGVLLLYVAVTLVVGCVWVRRSRTAREFTIAGSSLPAWAVGLSVFGTYLSSNTFLGLPGKAFASNWNAFVFSLSLPPAAWLAVKFFVPFYRRCGETSAYSHLSARFGPWACLYAVACYLLTQLARTGTILFGSALCLEALTGFRIEVVIVVAGALVTVYTFAGGMRAVVWTDVLQSGVLIAGAVVILFSVYGGMPEGWTQAVRLGSAADKFSLGSWSARVDASTVWTVFLYGLFINLTNFGIDQNYIQRYHTAKSDRAAARSLWLGALLYVPVSLVFFLIGAGLYSHYQVDDEARRQLLSNPSATASAEAAELSDAAIADRALPQFIATRLRGGFAGLVVAAILAAAMSTLSSSFNSAATVYLADVHPRLFKTRLDERGEMRVLHAFTLLFGVAGTGTALALIGAKGILDTWWNLSGIFAGGMLGLFLLGRLSRAAGSRAAMVGVGAGVAAIFWMSRSPGATLPRWAVSPFHSNLIIVIGTLVILAVGCAAALFWARGREREAASSCRPS